MKIVSYLQGFYTKDLIWDEVCPLDGFVPELFNQVAQTLFKAQQVGASSVAHASGQLAPMMAMASIADADMIIPVYSLDFQPTRVLVSSNTTANAKRAFEIIMANLHPLGFRNDTDDRRSEYCRSTIIAAMQSDIAETVDRLKSLNAIFQRCQNPAAKALIPLGVRYLPSDATDDEYTFVLERRMNAPASENWWFSQGPFTTEENEEILREIERSFTV